MKIEEPTLLFENELVIKIYNAIVGYNNDIDWTGFSFFCELYDIKDIEYFADCLTIIKHTINNTYEKIEAQKQKGIDINKKANEIMKSKGLL